MKSRPGQTAGPAAPAAHSFPQSVSSPRHGLRAAPVYEGGGGPRFVTYDDARLCSGDVQVLKGCSLKLNLILFEGVMEHACWWEEG